MLRDGQPDAFQAASGQHVVGHRGRLISSDAGSTVAIFDAPGQAIRCAAALRDTAAAHGIEVRAGIHTGEVDLAGNGIAGTSVHIADEVAALAQPAEILVSRTVKDLVAGSSIGFISGAVTGWADCRTNGRCSRSPGSKPRRGCPAGFRGLHCHQGVSAAM